MKHMIRRVVARGRVWLGPRASSLLSSEMTSWDLKEAYRLLIAETLGRLDVPADAVEIQVKRAGAGPKGLPAFTGRVRLLRWDPAASPTWLKRMPAADARVRKLVAVSLLLQQTHFAGLWFQADSTIAGVPADPETVPAELV